MENDCNEKGGKIRYNIPVTRIVYNEQGAVVHAARGESYSAKKIIITVSLGVLKAGMLVFEPPLNRHAAAIASSGFGDAIKMFLEFKTPLQHLCAEDVGFIISEESISTWWTQLPRKKNYLVGWAGGPQASALKDKSDEELLDLGLTSLSAIFKLEEKVLRDQLKEFRICNWHKNELARGGYSFNTVDCKDIKKVLSEPLSGTVYFAGEGCYDGEHQGTVEAALQSGKAVAAAVAKSFAEE